MYVKHLRHVVALIQCIDMTISAESDSECKNNNGKNKNVHQ